MSVSDLLKRVAEELENAYTLQDVVGGRQVRDLGIAEVIAHIRKPPRPFERRELLLSHYSSLSFIGDRIHFLGDALFPYDNFPESDDMYGILEKFRTHNGIDVDSREDINQIVKALQLVERNDMDMRYDLTYLYLRLFVVTATIGSLLESAVIAKLIMTQL